MNISQFSFNYFHKINYRKYKYPNNIIDYKINDRDLSEDEFTTTSSDESTENNQEYRILINAQDNQNIYRPYYNFTCKILKARRKKSVFSATSWK